MKVGDLVVPVRAEALVHEHMQPMFSSRGRARVPIHTIPHEPSSIPHEPSSNFSSSSSNPLILQHSHPKTLILKYCVIDAYVVSQEDPLPPCFYGKLRSFW